MVYINAYSRVPALLAVAHRDYLLKSTNVWATGLLHGAIITN